MLVPRAWRNIHTIFQKALMTTNGLLKTARGALRKMDFLEMCFLPEAGYMLAEEIICTNLYTDGEPLSQTASYGNPLLIFIEQI